MYPDWVSGSEVRMARMFDAETGPRIVANWVLSTKKASSLL
jgi:hypothetical protein